jgi:hypothetical protein
MAKRTPGAVSPSGAAQPEPVPVAAMVEPAAGPPAAEPAPALDPAPAIEAPGATVVPGAWPDVSTAPAGPHCPWCSAPLASTDLATCPSCGAQLNAPAEADVPGVTSIDVAALAWKAGAPRRSKILSWISGESDDPPDSSGASASAVEPPSLAVRREMLRLELEAEGITLPHDAEPSAAEEADAVAEAGSGDTESATPGA